MQLIVCKILIPIISSIWDDVIMPLSSLISRVYLLLFALPPFCLRSCAWCFRLFKCLCVLMCLGADVLCLCLHVMNCPLKCYDFICCQPARDSAHGLEERLSYLTGLCLCVVFYAFVF